MTATVMAKGMPGNLLAERMILGAILMDQALLHTSRPLLTEDDFSQERHRRIWDQFCKLYDAGVGVDHVTVFSALNAAKPDQDMLSYLLDLQEGMPQLPNVDSYIRDVQDQSLRRRLIYSGQHLVNRASSGVERPQDILNDIGQSLLALSPTQSNVGLQSAKELVDEFGVEKLLSSRRQSGLLFPWPWMNRVTNGMLPAELWILAGYTSMGKTSAMLQHAVNVAEHGKGVAIFSLEVGKQSLFQKACYQLARVDSERGKAGKLSREERQQLAMAASRLYELPIYFDTQANTTMAIHAALRRRMVQNQVHHVIVDYLQLLGDSGKHQNRAQSVGANAWAMKMLASDFQIPVLLLSQLSRPLPNKDGSIPEPHLGSLKESGDIENHANGVWFVHRTTNEDADQVPVKFMLPKQRDGRRNIYNDFWFMQQYQRFEAQVEESEENE